MPTVTRPGPARERSAAQIMGSAEDIYLRFTIPPNLQMHMMRVAAVGALICDSWKGPKINKEEIVATLLIHDLGNITKFNLDSPHSIAMMGDEMGRIGFWRHAKAETIRRYGDDYHRATLLMAQELMVPKGLLSLLDNMWKSENSLYEPGPDDWPLKICIYSDMRVGPDGVIPTEARINDLLERYRGTPNEARCKSLAGIARAAEGGIVQMMTIETSTINDSTVKPYLKIFHPLR